MYQPHVRVQAFIHDARDYRKIYESSQKLRKWLAIEEQEIENKYNPAELSLVLR